MGVGGGPAPGLTLRLPTDITINRFSPESSAHGSRGGTHSELIARLKRLPGRTFGSDANSAPAKATGDVQSSVTFSGDPAGVTGVKVRHQRRRPSCHGRKWCGNFDLHSPGGTQIPGDDRAKNPISTTPTSAERLRLLATMGRRRRRTTASHRAIVSVESAMRGQIHPPC